MAEQAPPGLPAEAAAPPPRAADGRDPVASLAAQLRNAGTGTSARLRRFHPQQAAQAALFDTERLLLAAGLQPRDRDEHARWALVLHCLALAQGRHDPGAEPGAVLARLRLGEARLRQLVEADERVLASLMPRLARRLAAAQAAVNWRPLAELLLHGGSVDPVRRQRADGARQRLVRHYLEGQNRAPADAPAAARSDPPSDDPADAAVQGA